MIKLDGNRKEALRYLGYKGQILNAQTEEQLDLCLKEGLSLAAPRGVYHVFDIEKTDKGLSLIGTDLTLEGENIGRYLDGAKKCAVMAVTVGIAIDRAVIKYEKSGEITKALMLDCVATALVEEAADKFNAEIDENARENRFVTRTRFSPGYGDFPLDTQRKIIPLLDCERRLGIILNSECLMTPRKGVTAVIGFFEGEGNENGFEK